MGEKVNRVIKIVVGILLLVLGILFLAAPVITTAFAIMVAGMLLIAMGGAEFIVGMLPNTKKEKHAAHIVTALFKLFLGILLLVLDKTIVKYLPEIVMVWLVLFGVHHIILGVRCRRADGENWVSSIAIGILAIAGAVALAITKWVVAVDMIGVLIAVLSILYGFILLMDAFIKTSKKSVEDILEEDERISEEENSDFRRFQERLNRHDK